MILYLSLILFAILAISGLNAMCGPLNFGEAFTWVGYATLAMVVIDAVIAALVHALPAKRIDPFHGTFVVKRSERLFYEKLGVRKWKDLIPETGKYLCGFAKDKILEPQNNEYLLRFLRETCYAEMMHLLSFVLSPVPIIWMPYKWTITLPVALTNMLLQLLPVIVQRYNRIRLVKLYQFNQRRERV